MSTSQDLYGDYFFEGVLAQMRPVTCQEISIGQFFLKPGEDFLQAVDCFGLKKVLESSIIQSFIGLNSLFKNCTFLFKS